MSSYYYNSFVTFLYLSQGLLSWTSALVSALTCISGEKSFFASVALLLTIFIPQCIAMAITRLALLMTVTLVLLPGTEGQHSDFRQQRRAAFRMQLGMYVAS